VSLGSRPQIALGAVGKAIRDRRHKSVERLVRPAPLAAREFGEKMRSGEADYRYDPKQIS
jgi:hypothetical protein